MEVTLVWSAAIDDDGAPLCERVKSSFVSLFEPMPYDAAATVIRYWLEDASNEGYVSNWTANFDDEVTEASAVVVIHEPAEMAGVFCVDITRKIQTFGHLADDITCRDFAEFIARTEAEPAT